MAPTSDEKPKPGDLIEINRGVYQHWAVYIGDDVVVHLAPACEGPMAGCSSVGSVVQNTAVVKKEKLLDLVGEDKWCIKNSLDEEYTPREGHEIVKDALERAGKECSYCLFTRNCEHFATELRYGNSESRQVRSVTIVTCWGVIATAFFAGLLAIFLRMRHLFKREKKE